jgi:acyl-homoserine-lactone acylase
MLFSIFWSKVSARPDIWTVPFNPADPINTPRSLAIEGRAAEALLADLNAAAEALQKLGIAADAPLGQIQFAERGAEHVPISGLGNGGVLNNISARPVAGGLSVFHGSSYVQAVGFDDKGPVVNAVLTYSQSTDPASPYYADQTRAFSKRQLRRYPFSAAEIKADAVGIPLTIRQ